LIFCSRLDLLLGLTADEEIMVRNRPQDVTSRMALIPAFVVILVSSLAVGQIPSPNGPALSVRSVDFSNMTYPYTNGLRLSQKTFTLRDGIFEETPSAVGMKLDHLAFVDVTGDGIEEAILYFAVRTRGSTQPGCVYIYSMSGDQLALLWAFDTGDRADG